MEFDKIVTACFAACGVVRLTVKTVIFKTLSLCVGFYHFMIVHSKSLNSLKAILRPSEINLISTATSYYNEL